VGAFACFFSSLKVHSQVNESTTPSSRLSPVWARLDTEAGRRAYLSEM
jgi:hypothetical protein